MFYERRNNGVLAGLDGPDDYEYDTFTPARKESKPKPRREVINSARPAHTPKIPVFQQPRQIAIASPSTVVTRAPEPPSYSAPTTTVAPSDIAPGKQVVAQRAPVVRPPVIPGANLFKALDQIAASSTREPERRPQAVPPRPLSVRVTDPGIQRLMMPVRQQLSPAAPPLGSSALDRAAATKEVGAVAGSKLVSMMARAQTFKSIDDSFDKLKISAPTKMTTSAGDRMLKQILSAKSEFDKPATTDPLKQFMAGRITAVIDKNKIKALAIRNFLRTTDSYNAIENPEQFRSDVMESVRAWNEMVEQMKQDARNASVTAWNDVIRRREEVTPRRVAAK